MTTTASAAAAHVLVGARCQRRRTSGFSTGALRCFRLPLRYVALFSFFLLLVRSTTLAAGATPTTSSSTSWGAQDLRIETIHGTSDLVCTVALVSPVSSANSFPESNRSQLVKLDVDREGSDVALVRSCPDMTLITSVQGPIEFKKAGQEDGLPIVALFNGQTYEFGFAVRLNATSVLSQRVLADFLDGGGAGTCAPQNFRFLARVVLCDALHFGVCSPYLLVEDDDEQAVEAGGGTDEHRGQDASSEFKVLSSPWMNFTQVYYDDTECVYTAAVNTTLQVPPETKSSAYYVLADVLVVFDGVVPENNSAIPNILSNASANLVKMHVVASTPGDTAVVIQQPPEILMVSRGMTLYLGIAVAVFGILALACFAIIVRHRDHPVMKLVQGPFLATLAAACFVQITCSFTYLPLCDAFCQLSGPLVLIPVDLGSTILIARMWRVYVTLAGAHQIGRMDTNHADNETRKKCRCDCSNGYQKRFIAALGWLAGIPYLICQRNEEDRARRSRYGLRRAVTARETLSLITILTIPQIALQIFGSVYYQRNLELQVASDDAIGRVVCETKGRWVAMVGTALICLHYVCAVYLAWISRMLPAFFNETGQIFTSAAVCVLLALIVFPLLLFTNNPSTRFVRCAASFHKLFLRRPRG